MNLKKCDSILHCFDEKILIIASFRYFLGRRTIATCDFAQTLAKNWHKLDIDVQDTIQRELEKEFELDDIARKNGKNVLPLGMDCDRNAWSLVLNCYHP